MKKAAFAAVLLTACVFVFSIRANAGDIRELKTFGVFGNYAMPRGDFNKSYDSSIAGGLKIGYGITNNVGAEFAFSVFNFSGKKDVDDTSIDCFRLNMFYRFDTTTNFYPLFSVGAGYYMPEDSQGDADSSDNEFGINFGLGFISELIDLNDMFAIEVTGNYHHIFNNGKDTTFFEIRTGLNFNLF